VELEMNERIKQLAEQCRGNPMTSEFEPLFDKAKFAELIVWECADIALTEAQSNGNFDTFNKIVKHFGVSV
jgi:hypothetical protein